MITQIAETQDCRFEGHWIPVRQLKRTVYIQESCAGVHSANVPAVAYLLFVTFCGITHELNCIMKPSARLSCLLLCLVVLAASTTRARPTEDGTAICLLVTRMYSS